MMPNSGTKAVFVSQMFVEMIEKADFNKYIENYKIFVNVT